MELRTYLEILRRRRVLIVAVTVIVAAVAGVTSSLTTSLYTATAQVMLRQGDPAEELNPGTAARPYVDPDRHVAGQIDIIESENVAGAAAQELGEGDAGALLDGVSAHQAGTTDIIAISYTDPDPAQASRAANAFAHAYIENRRSTSVAGLERASREVDAKLIEAERRLASLDQEIAKTPPAPQNLEPLKAAREAAAVQYAALYSRQQELLITASLKRGEAELIADAGVPRAPSSPHPKRDLALGTVVGLMLALGLAFLREQLDGRLHSREDVENATNLPVLSELPLDAEAAKHPYQVAAHERRNGGLAEAARGLRTQVAFLGIDEPIRRLLITSPGKGDGKSFVAANLATVYAQAGFRTVLVSADLRRPRLESLFPGIAPGPGLTGVIAGLTDTPSTNGHGATKPGSAVVATALRPTRIDGLQFLPAGELPPNPAELLGSRRAGVVWEALSHLADVVIIDSPPVIAVTDAAVLAPNVDGVLLVAAPDRTHRAALSQTVGLLSAKGVRILGVVLNQVEGRGGSYAAYYGDYSKPHTDVSGLASRWPWLRRLGDRQAAGNSAKDKVGVE